MRFLKQARLLDFSESSMEFQTLAPKKRTQVLFWRESFYFFTTAEHR